MGFITALHTFGAWAEKELAILVGEAPKVEQVIASVLKYAGPALQIVATAEAGAPAGAVVGKVVADAQAGLTAASGLIYDFGVHPTIATVIGSVESNLSALLSAGHITNASSVASVTKVVSELNGLVKVLASPAPTPAA
jgi:hypothetical protein